MNGCTGHVQGAAGNSVGILSTCSCPDEIESAGLFHRIDYVSAPHLDALDSVFRPETGQVHPRDQVLDRCTTAPATALFQRPDRRLEPTFRTSRPRYLGFS